MEAAILLFFIIFFIYILITKIILLILKRTRIWEKILIKFKKNDINETSENLPYKKNEYFFTMNEKHLYSIINKIAEKMNVVIFSKVRLADLIYIKSKSENYYTHWNKIKAKHIDFVICNKINYNILFVIELDDKSHERQDRIERDIFIDNALEAAKLPYFHIKVENNYNADYLEEIFKTFIKEEHAI